MSFKKAVNELTLKATRAYAAMYQALNIYEGANPRTILKIFDTMISPIYMYGSEVWAPYILRGNLKQIMSNINSKMEKLQTRVCKNILGMKRNVTNLACCLEVGRFPIVVEILLMLIGIILDYKALQVIHC